MCPTKRHKPKDFQRDYLTARVVCEEEGLAAQSVSYAFDCTQSKGIVGELARELYSLGMYGEEALHRVQARVETLRSLDPPESIALKISAQIQRELFRREGIALDEISHILLHELVAGDDGSGLLKNLRKNHFLTRTEARQIRSQARARYYRYALREYLGIATQDGSSDSLPYWIRDGWELGDFELHRELGRGNAGIVFEAHQKSIDRLVALKIIAPYGQQEERLTRFRREVENLTRLQHPNVVSIYKVGNVGSLYYLSMLLVDGPSLSDRIEENSLSKREGIEIVRDIARALDHAHRLGVVHRDVKPANILLDSKGIPYLTDFGLAKAIGSDQTVTRDGKQIGTPYYMAPEQVCSDASQIGPVSDVYSLGVVLYEVVTGRRPFTGDSLIQVYHAITRTTPSHPSEISRDIQENLAAIILKSIARDPETRYQSASAFSHDLTCYLHGRPIQARPPSILVRTLRNARRVSLRTTLLLALGVGLAVVGGLHLREIRLSRLPPPSSPPEKQAPEPAKNHQQNLEALSNFHLARGQESVLSGDWEQALESFERVLQFDPNNARAHFQSGRALRALGRREEALASLARALRIQPSLVAAHIEWARCHIEQGEHQAAREALLKAVGIDDSWSETHFLLAMTTYRLGDLEGATDHLSHIIQIDPHSARARYLRARIHLATNRIERAKNDLDEAIRLETDHSQAYFERAGIHEKQDLNIEAIRDYERSLLSDPDHSRAADARRRISILRKSR